MMAGVSCTLAEVPKDNRRCLFAAHTRLQRRRKYFPRPQPNFWNSMPPNRRSIAYVARSPALCESHIGGTTPLPNRTAPLSNVPSACFSVGTKTFAPGVMSLSSAGTTATIGTFVGMVIFFSPPL
jgi:hypothetical protein